MTDTAQATTWTPERALAIFSKPLMELLFEAHSVHRENFSPNEVQLSTLLSIKTGACTEDCAYCSQSGRHRTEVDHEQLLPLEVVKSHAQAAKEKGATRFCMGAAWRSPPRKEMPKLIEMVREVRAMGLETCMTLGMLADDQVDELKEAGLDYYNHNLDTSRDYYSEVITTRTYQDRLDTLERVRDAGIKVCCGGIVGMGETREDRVGLLCELANLPQPPESVPINKLVPIPGTPLGDVDAIDEMEFVRMIATARIMMPASRVRLSAGRESMPKSMQAMCFFAGANSIFYGEQLLTAPNAQAKEDMEMFESFGIHTVEQVEEPSNLLAGCGAE